MALTGRNVVPMLPLLGLVGCLLFSFVQSGPQPHATRRPNQAIGELDQQFTPSQPVRLVFTKVDAASDVPRPPVKATAGWAASIPLPHLVSLPKGGSLAVGAVRDEAGTTTFYADLNLDGELGNDERISFVPWQDDHYSAYSILKVQLQGPPARIFGVAVLLPKGGADLPQLGYAFGASVDGRVNVDGRTVLVRLPFDLAQEAVNLQDYLRVDCNGDGKIDNMNVSNEVAYAPHGLPVFRVGTHYLSFLSADYAAHRFVMREHPAADYKWIDLSVGKQVPDFRFTTFDRRERRLSDYRGKYLLVIYWDRLCGFAEREVPFVNAAYAEFRNRGLEVLGLLNEDDPAGMATFLKDKGITWVNALPESTKELVRERLRFFATPTCILLDPDGRVVSRGEEGEPEVRGDGLKSTLERLLSKRQ
jgi:peroxiredoxin